METRYLVDNNALAALRRDQIRTDFFRSYCEVTTDVLWEAREHPEKATLEKSTRPWTPRFLEQVRTVMETVAAGDTRLVDLYKNKGAADPGLIASVLEAASEDAETLFSDTWILVTNDQAAADKATDFGIAIIKPKELAERIDASLA